MNEPQVWTLISVFSVAIFAVLGVMSGLITQVLRAEVGKVSVQIASVEQRIDGLRNEVNGRIDGLSAKFDSVDRDVQAIAHRVLPDPQ